MLIDNNENNNNGSVDNGNSHSIANNNNSNSENNSNFFSMDHISQNGVIQSITADNTDNDANDPISNSSQHGNSNESTTNSSNIVIMFGNEPLDLELDTVIDNDCPSESMMVDSSTDTSNITDIMEPAITTTSSSSSSKSVLSTIKPSLSTIVLPQQHKSMTVQHSSKDNDKFNKDSTTTINATTDLNYHIPSTTNGASVSAHDYNNNTGNENEGMEENDTMDTCALGNQTGGDMSNIENKANYCGSSSNNSDFDDDNDDDSINSGNEQIETIGDEIIPNYEQKSLKKWSGRTRGYVKNYNENIDNDDGDKGGKANVSNSLPLKRSKWTGRTRGSSASIISVMENMNNNSHGNHASSENENDDDSDMLLDDNHDDDDDIVENTAIENSKPIILISGAPNNISNHNNNNNNARKLSRIPLRVPRLHPPPSSLLKRLSPSLPSPGTTFSPSNAVTDSSTTANISEDVKVKIESNCSATQTPPANALPNIQSPQPSRKRERICDELNFTAFGSYLTQPNPLKRVKTNNDKKGLLSPIGFEKDFGKTIEKQAIVEFISKKRIGIDNQVEEGEEEEEEEEIGDLSNFHTQKPVIVTTSDEEDDYDDINNADEEDEEQNEEFLGSSNNDSCMEESSSLTSPLLLKKKIIRDDNIIGEYIKICWVDESDVKTWYSGIVADYNNKTKQHFIKYDDGECEWEDLDKEEHEILHFRCAVCGEKERSHDLLHKHIVEVHKQPPLCAHCDPQTIGQKHVIKGIKKTYKRKKRRNECSFRGCYFCGTPDEIAKHHEEHLQKRPYECNKCHNRFTTESSVKCHFRNVHCLRRFNCSLCSKSFKTHGDIHKHLKTHKKECICQFCVLKDASKTPFTTWDKLIPQRAFNDEPSFTFHNDEENDSSDDDTDIPLNELVSHVTESTEQNDESRNNKTTTTITTTPSSTDNTVQVEKSEGNLFNDRGGLSAINANSSEKQQSQQLEPQHDHDQYHQHDEQQQQQQKQVKLEVTMAPSLHVLNGQNEPQTVITNQQKVIDEVQEQQQQQPQQQVQSFGMQIDPQRVNVQLQLKEVQQQQLPQSIDEDQQPEQQLSQHKQEPIPKQQQVQQVQHDAERSSQSSNVVNQQHQQQQTQLKSTMTTIQHDPRRVSQVAVAATNQQALNLHHQQEQEASSFLEDMSNSNGATRKKLDSPSQNVSCGDFQHLNPTRFLRTPQSPIQFPRSPTQFPRSPTQFPRSPTQFPRSPTQFPRSPTQFPRSPTQADAEPFSFIASGWPSHVNAIFGTSTPPAQRYVQEGNTSSYYRNHPIDEDSVYNLNGPPQPTKNWIY
eukprot:TRINITY_DN1127_c0_g1_i1.p1 TRINITY_DN1127_c0_g1~~TRINITY_DN1127_c0_g1_i1.p1  ORF type:complete len:1359 (+),score=440.20 TRINITY_DN1127_c0_g1_i1:155-4078(+)